MRNGRFLSQLLQRKMYERGALLGVHLTLITLSAAMRPTELDRLYMENPRLDDWVNSNIFSRLN